MYSTVDRTWFFWHICIPVRLSIVLLLTLLLYYVDNDAVRLVAASYCWVTAYFFLLNIFRQYFGYKSTGGFGGPCWWKNLRFFHVLTYSSTGVLIFYGIQFGSLLLLLDVLVGVMGKIYLS